LNSVRTLIFNARIQLEAIMIRMPAQSDNTFTGVTDVSDTSLPGARDFAIGHAYTVEGELRDVETTESPNGTPFRLPGGWDFTNGITLLI
jgi:hypothetical protein